MLVGRHLLEHLFGQVRGLKVGLVGLWSEDTHGEGQADQPQCDGAGEEQHRQPSLPIMDHQGLLQVAKGYGCEVDSLAEAGYGDELLGG